MDEERQRELLVAWQEGWEAALGRAMPYRYSRILGFLSFVTGTEMSEGSWRTFPHCCGQAGCWMHTPFNGAWCRCKCPWCRVARRLNRGVQTMDLLIERRKRAYEQP